ncbi:uncharacterized protein LOC107787500 isoform X1 [Nicotiana tabacum]
MALFLLPSQSESKEHGSFRACLDVREVGWTRGINSNFVTGVDSFLLFARSQRNRISDMTRGRGRDSITRGDKSSVRGRGNSTIRANMPSVPIPIISPQQGGTSSFIGQNHINQVQTLAPSSMTPVQTSGHGSTPTIHSESSPNTPDQSNPIGEGISTQSNTIGEGECASSHGQRTLVTLAPTGLEPSGLCSTKIFKSFKHELDHNGINWKSVSDEIQNFYWGEFKKKFYLYSSIDSAVRSQWENKASIRYKDIISKMKTKKIRPRGVPVEVWESWEQLWKDPKCVEKLEINANNRRGGRGGVSTGTHTGGSVSIGEYCKRLAVEKGRDPTPSELHLYVHTHGHDGKSFLDEKARIVHEQTKTQSDIDQWKAYYEAAGGEKKRRVYGLRSQAKCYYGPNLRGSSGSDASSSIPPSSAQSTLNLDELVMHLIPTLTEHIVPVLTDHMHPVLTEWVREMISSPSLTSTDRPSDVVPTVHAPPTATVHGVHPSVSDDDLNP